MKHLRALLLSATLFTAFVPQAIAQDASLPKISVITAQKKQLAANLSVTGSFAAGELVLVTPEVEGQLVNAILAEEGDDIKQGQVLAKLSSAAIDIKILQTKAALASNDASIKQAENQIAQASISEARAAADLNRTKKLRTSGVSTVEQLDQRQATYDLASATLAGAELAVDVAKANRLSTEAQMQELALNKSRTEIKAPVSGFISRRTVQLGSIASSGRDPMFNIVNEGVIKLVVEVAESDLPKVKVGQKAAITVNGIAQTLEGEVKLVTPEVNEATRTGKAHIRVNNKQRIPLGSFGRADIALGAADGVALPLTAVAFGEDGPTVQLVRNGKIVEQRVLTGLVSTTEIEITNGVNVGDMVVARAGSFVRSGDAVTPVPVQ